MLKTTLVVDLTALAGIGDKEQDDKGIWRENRDRKNQQRRAIKARAKNLSS